MTYRSVRQGGVALLLVCLALAGGDPTAVFSQSASGAVSRYEQGRRFMIEADWYSAAEALLESLRINPAHAESVVALAECYYELGEYDQALTWVKKARTLSRASAAAANLEALILIALGKLEGAASVIAEVLVREPYNKEALFAAAELDVARGRAGDAVARYREAVRRYPDDRRALLSLALVLGSLGDPVAAAAYAARAVERHPDDPRVHYYAAYLDSAAGRLDSASSGLESALTLKPSFTAARSLLASVRYRSGRFEEAARLADAAIAENRDDGLAWYLKGLSYVRLGRSAEAMTILKGALAVDGEDEFIRAALENVVSGSTSLEDAGRVPLARWHFVRAREYRSRNLSDQALFEYRRGLRLYPYAPDRREYAELLRVMGYPARQLAELRFLQEQGRSDQAVNDAVEAYDSLLVDALHRRWNVDPVELASRHWKLAVFSVAAQSAFNHVDAASVAAVYVRDLLSHDGNAVALNLPTDQNSFSAAFRAAREAEADYFLILSVAEGDRDLSLRGELFVGRTGAPAAEYRSYRSGADRLRNAARGIVDLVAAALPFRAHLVRRQAGAALMDKGRADGVEPKASYEIVRRGAAQPRNEGLGLSYARQDVVGTLLIDEVDEQIAAGTVSRVGFFDRIAAGDEILKSPGEQNPVPQQDEAVMDPELRTLLRTLR